MFVSMLLTITRLTNLLRYDPETGEFRWLRSRGQARIGAVAGWRQPCRRGPTYWMIGLDGRRYMRSRLVWFYMTGEWPPDEIDHRDVDSMNDRWSNLRAATRSQNEANKRCYRNNKMGLKGVYPSKGKWEARIRRNGQREYLGRFDTALAAHAAYAAASQKIDGPFSRV